MPILNLSAASKNDVVNSLRNALDSGGASGTLRMYGGRQVAPSEEANQRELLAELTFSYPSAPDATEGILDFNELEREDFIKNTGKAIWARAFSSEGQAVFDCDVGLESSGAMIKLNDVQFFKGGTVTVGAFSLKYPEVKQVVG